MAEDLSLSSAESHKHPVRYDRASQAIFLLSSKKALKSAQGNRDEVRRILEKLERFYEECQIKKNTKRLYDTLELMSEASIGIGEDLTQIRHFDDLLEEHENENRMLDQGSQHSQNTLDARFERKVKADKVANEASTISDNHNTQAMLDIALDFAGAAESIFYLDPKATRHEILAQMLGIQGHIWTARAEHARSKAMRGRSQAAEFEELKTSTCSALRLTLRTTAMQFFEPSYLNGAASNGASVGMLLQDFVLFHSLSEQMKPCLALASAQPTDLRPALVVAKYMDMVDAMETAFYEAIEQERIWSKQQADCVFGEIWRILGVFSPGHRGRQAEVKATVLEDVMSAYSKHKSFNVFLNECCAILVSPRSKQQRLTFWKYQEDGGWTATDEAWKEGSEKESRRSLLATWYPEDHQNYV